MNHPYETNINANLKYHQMLNDADAHRRANRINNQRPSFFKALTALFSGVSKADRIETAQTTTQEAGTAA